MVGLGLAGIPDDEVAAERGVGVAVADVGDPAQEALTVAPSPHPPQQRLRDVLEREVEVRDARTDDRVDQLVGEVGRVEVEQPHPVDHVGDLLHERHDRPCTELGRAVLAVAGEVLGDEDDLLRAELLDLAEDRRDVPAALRTAERRNGAEPARAVAALGDLDVRPRRRRRGPRQVQQVEQRQRGGAPPITVRPAGLRPSATGTPKPATWSTSGSASASSAP